MHVVVIEPSRVGLSVLSGMLTDRGYQVSPFSSGAKAFEFILDNEDVEIVITSFETEDKSGLELCWELRLLAEHGRMIYSIALSSSTEEEKITEALDAGADEFIHKLPEKTELFARLRSAERYLLSQRELLRLAQTDPLTGMLNRRAFMARGAAACEQLEGRYLSIITLDVDHFKSINDRFGHDGGDLALQALAHCLETFEDAIAGRLGGEEFALITKDMRAQEARQFADLVRARIASEPILLASTTLNITCSLGVATSFPRHELAPLMKQSDQALYQAKADGRNRVVSFAMSAAAA